MIQQVKTAYMYLIVIGIGVMLFVFSTFIPVISSDADFSIYNSDWNGCSNLGRDVYEGGSFVPTIDISGSSGDTILHSPLNELERIEPAETSIFIIGPQTGFSDEEIDFLSEFLGKGGKLLIADDFGSGNELLSALGTDTRISRTPMFDLAFDRNVNFSVSTEMSDHPITRDVSMLIFNIPYTITPSDKAVAVFNSSRTSWLDVIDNQEKDEEEPSGPFPMMTSERYGKGELVV
ncbi:MAG: DUF4350 domain-containing protein, partial [Candidatus Fermentibacteria bacterium]